MMMKGINIRKKKHLLSITRRIVAQTRIGATSWSGPCLIKTPMQMRSGVHLNTRTSAWNKEWKSAYLFFQHDHSLGIMTFMEYLSMQSSVWFFFPPPPASDSLLRPQHLVLHGWAREGGGGGGGGGGGIKKNERLREKKNKVSYQAERQPRCCILETKMSTKKPSMWN